MTDIITEAEREGMLDRHVAEKVRALRLRCEEYAGLEGAGRGEMFRLLFEDHEWSEEGARTLYSLASDYGAFILVSALALVMGIEDGKLGL